MTDVASQFIAQSRGFLSSDYLPKIEHCLAALSDEDVWWRANEGSNSIGNLLLHLDGSTRAWIVGVAGGSHSPRDRQREFDEREQIPRSALMSRLRQTLAEADEVLARLDAGALLEQAAGSGRGGHGVVGDLPCGRALLDAHGANHHAGENAFGRPPTPGLSEPCGTGRHSFGGRLFVA